MMKFSNFGLGHTNLVFMFLTTVIPKLIYIYFNFEKLEDRNIRMEREFQYQSISSS